MDIHDRVSELEARISKLETHLQRLVSMADPSLQRVMLELDATRGQETAILECPPFQVLHDQEVDAILAADVEHWADMRMIQGGQGFCLQLESLFQLRI